MCSNVFGCLPDGRRFILFILSGTNLGQDWASQSCCYSALGGWLRGEGTEGCSLTQRSPQTSFLGIICVKGWVWAHRDVFLVAEHPSGCGGGCGGACCTEGLLISCSCKGDSGSWEWEFCSVSAHVPWRLSACGGIWRWVLARCIKVYFLYFKCPKCRSFEVMFFRSDVCLCVSIRLILSVFPNCARLLRCAYLPNLPVLAAVHGELVCENRKKRKLHPSITQSQMARNTDNLPGQRWAVALVELIPRSSVNSCSSCPCPGFVWFPPFPFGDCNFVAASPSTLPLLGGYHGGWLGRGLRCLPGGSSALPCPQLHAR